MYTLNKCLVHSCQNIALSTIGEDGTIQDTRGYCLDHIPNPGQALEAISRYITEHERIVGLNASGMLFHDMDFSGKRFYGCNMLRCTFKNVHSEGVRARMSMFDMSQFDVCTIIQANIQFCSFGGSKFSHTLFTGSDMVQNNFNGIMAFQCSFDNSDLYNSRFIKSTLVNTSFRDCNVKKTLFIAAMRENVSFRKSNTLEAIFDTEGSALYNGEQDTP